MAKMANWWEARFELIGTDLGALLLQGDPIAILFVLVVVLFGYPAWIGIRAVWEHYRSR